MFRTTRWDGMNRDVYSVLLGKARKLININLLNVNGQWMKAPVHQDVVKGYHFCKCVLICIRNCNPDKQGNSFIVDTWDKLMDIHHDDNAYRLMPIKAEHTTALSLMMSVTQLPGSPFHIDHRVDHVPYRTSFAYKSPVRAAVTKFFKLPEGSNLPIDRIEFDGVLDGPKDLGLCVVRPAVTTENLIGFSKMMSYIDSDDFMAIANGVVYDPHVWTPVRDTKKRKRHLFLGAEVPMPPTSERALLELAGQLGIHIFQKKGNGHFFNYVPPAGSAAMVVQNVSVPNMAGIPPQPRVLKLPLPAEHLKERPADPWGF